MRVGDIHDLPAQSLNNKASPDARKVAQEFEALFTSFLMRAMRNTITRSDFIPESLGEKIYTQMLDDEYARVISEHGNLGLADLILKEIEESEGDGDALQTLRGLNQQPWMIDNRLVPQAAQGESTSLRERLDAYGDLVKEASAKYGVDEHLIAAVIARESSGNPRAVSRKGAKGLMQLVDSTAQEMGVRRVFDPRDNIDGGTRYLKSLLELHSGDERLALASYNAGPAAVERYNGIPPYPETQDYVESVLRMRRSFAGQSNKDGE